MTKTVRYWGPDHKSPCKDAAFYSKFEGKALKIFEQKILDLSSILKDHLSSMLRTEAGIAYCHYEHSAMIQKR